MRELEQENEWEVPELVLPRAWERVRGLYWREARRLSVLARGVLRAPELVRETEPGRPPEREHEWKARSYFGNGGL